MLDYLLVLFIISYHDNFCQKSHKTENNKIQAAHIKKEVRAVCQSVDRFLQVSCHWPICDINIKVGLRNYWPWNGLKLPTATAHWRCYREVFAPKTENMWRIIKNKRVIMTLPELQIWVCDGFSKPVCHLFQRIFNILFVGWLVINRQ